MDLCALIILVLILLLVFLFDMQHAAGFWTDTKNPDRVLPPNKIINKGYNSEYYDCFELHSALGTPNNDMLKKCGKFI